MKNMAEQSKFGEMMEKFFKDIRYYKRLIQIVQEEGDDVHPMVKLTHYEIEYVKCQCGTVINFLIGNIPSRFSTFLKAAVFRTSVIQTSFEKMDLPSISIQKRKQRKTAKWQIQLHDLI